MLRRFLFVFILSFIFSINSWAQVRPLSRAGSELSADERALIQAQIENTKAQAENARAQAEWARTQMKARINSPNDSWHKFTTDPADALAAIASVFAMALAFLLLLLNALNYKTALMMQENSAFYEAMRRLGDAKDAAARCAAALTVAEMASKNNGRNPYFHFAKSELTVIRDIEENPLVKDFLSKLLAEKLSI